jgi:GntR family transcriptional regulator
MAGPHTRGIPLYVELAQELREKIVSKELKPGDPLPTELELSERNQVSRSTVRLAYNQLVSEGLVSAGQGRSGRRVRDNSPIAFYASRSESMDRTDARDITGIDAWVADVEEEGRVPDQKISTEIVNADAATALCLEVEEGTPLVVRRRLRTVDGMPHNINDTFYPMDIAGDTPIMYPKDVKEGVIALMRKMGHVQVGYRDELSWRPPTPDEARRLNIPSGVSVLIQARTGRTMERPVKLTVTVWPGDRAKIIYELPA